MKIFCDFHHEELYESLCLLFEERLGCQLYRPIGLDWYTEGWWKLAPRLDVAQQYLCLDEQAADEFRKLQILEPYDGHTFRNVNVSLEEPGIYRVGSQVYPDRRYRAIEFNEFKETRFDIIISSLYDHYELYEQLIQLYQPRAKHIWQAGNNWPTPPGLRNILNSTKTICIPADVNSVYYHPEFSLELFKPTPCETSSIFNMMHFMQEPELFQALNSLLPELSFYSYGAKNQDGIIGPDIQKIAECFLRHGLLWHVKHEGDGYGFNLHHAAAAGKPIITRCSSFTGMTAESLLTDQETCIDLDQYTLPELVLRLRMFTARYEYYSENIISRFRDLVDFNREELAIRKFIEDLY